MKKPIHIFSIILLLLFLTSCSSLYQKTDPLVGKSIFFKQADPPIVNKEHIEILSNWKIEISGKFTYFGRIESEIVTYVSVMYNIFNYNGEIIGTALDNHNRLNDGDIWTYKATTYVDEEPFRWERVKVTIETNYGYFTLYE